jgi:hypothetical protein
MAHAANPEVRATSGPNFHAVGHSVGLVVTDVDTANGAYSWAVRRARPRARGNATREERAEALAQPPGDAEVIELGGWGLAGPIPPVAETSGPPSMLAVHTVWIEEADAEHLAVLRQLIDKHRERFSEVRVWVANGASSELQRWVAGGCVAELPPTDDELAAAQVVDLASMPEDAKPARVERSGVIGWAEGDNAAPSDPIAVEAPPPPTPADLEWAEHQRIAAAKLALRTGRDGPRSEPLAGALTRRLLREQQG